MRLHFLTLFPGMFDGPFRHSILSRAAQSGLVEFKIHDIRDFTYDRHRMADDYQFGGGGGMVMKAEPIFAAVEDVLSELTQLEMAKARVILTSPQGKVLDQKMAQELALQKHLIIICGRYEGVDERVRERLVTDDVSIGDYVLTGGELPAMVLADAVARLVPGVVGSESSVQGDSITTGILQHPVYTRPASFGGWEVPEVLLTGNHREIDRWRRRMALERTLDRRPDLLNQALLSKEDLEHLETIGYIPPGV
ncbi:tRNA (guanosine(37)-N1)-methyltransferase TrmD [SAR202 cluster bacterium AD-804-J14_MRT_500m]|nr:tRNA (guanosine(37)-N1)-methyltransferase TrmD [SAR202 cluster bacterium AD-804-J14_MRT_500m]